MKLSAEADSKSVLDGCHLPASQGQERSVAMTLEQRAQKVRKELFSRYDQLNALWEKAEEQLCKNHIPREVLFPFNSFDMNPGERNAQILQCLGLQKIKGKWRICYVEFPDRCECALEWWTPIIECSAEIRVQAAKHLSAFRKYTIEQAEAFVPEVDDAIQQLSSALDRLDNLAELLAERAKLNGKPQ
jgi:hypothetical protein